VRGCIPALRNEIASTLVLVREQLEAFGGESLGRIERDRGSILIQLVAQYTENIRQLLNGEKFIESGDVEIVAGARIAYCNACFAETVASVDPNVGVDVVEIRTIMRNLAGLKSTLFVPQETFEMLIKRQIMRLEGPALECVEQVEQELVALCEDPNLPDLVPPREGGREGGRERKRAPRPRRPAAPPEGDPRGSPARAAPEPVPGAGVRHDRLRAQDALQPDGPAAPVRQTAGAHAHTPPPPCPLLRPDTHATHPTAAAPPPPPLRPGARRAGERRFGR
jgi:hypothetical protein